MAGRVGTLRRRYRVVSAGPDPASVRRLDGLAAQRVTTDLEPALDGLTPDGEVVVLRRVAARTSLNLSGTADALLADAWSRDLAAAVGRAVATDPGDGANLVRFPSQAAFVAAFIADVLTGRAWQRWYFGAFARHRHRAAADAIAAVLTEYRDQLAAILAELDRLGMLERLVGTVALEPPVPGLSPESAAGPSDSELAAWQPLVAAAAEIAGVPVIGGPELARRWAAIRADMPEWRDAAALADAVAAIVAWLRRTGTAGRVTRSDAEAVAVAERLHDWLDAGRLAAALEAAAGVPAAGILGAASRPPGAAVRLPGATPRQQELLTVLATVSRERRNELGGGEGNAAADVTRLVAWVAAREPAWADDPLLPALVTRVVAAWHELARAARPAEALAAIAASDLATVGRADTAAPASSVATSLLALAPLGEPAAAVLAELTAIASTAGSAPADRFASPVAGILLLQRAILDTRLADLAAQHRYPRAGPAYLLAELGRRWAGPAGVAGDDLDPAVVLFAGPEAPAAASELDAAWAAVPAAEHRAWHDVVADLAATHRVPAAGDEPDVLGAIADVVVRIWARWLRGFEQSSVPYLLDQLVRRPGVVTLGADRVTVELARRPLDTLLEVAGYLRPIEALPGLAARRVDFVVGALG
jgi:hypothetical protein